MEREHFGRVYVYLLNLWEYKTWLLQTYTNQ